MQARYCPETLQHIMRALLAPVRQAHPARSLPTALRYHRRATSYRVR